jgi:hypothetical protein
MGSKNPLDRFPPGPHDDSEIEVTDKHTGGNERPSPQIELENPLRTAQTNTPIWGYPLTKQPDCHDSSAGASAGIRLAIITLTSSA